MPTNRDLGSMSDLHDAAPQWLAALELLRHHRSVRAYRDEAVGDADILRAVEAAQCAATSSALQAYGLLRVRDDAQRRRLAELTGDQAYVASCPAFFIVSGDSRRLRLAAREHGLERGENLESFLLCVIDAALFAQNLCLAFEAQGYGTCFIGGLRNRLEEVDRLLAVPEGVYPLFGLCVGRPAEDPGKRPRFMPEAILEDGAWHPESELKSQIEAYDARMRTYYADRGKPGHDWSTGVAKKFRRPSRPELAAYYRSKGARLI